MLILSRARPAADATATAAPAGIIDGDAEDPSNAPYRFECRACPYEYVLERAYRERRTFERKRAGDVVGGDASWENVDRTAGMPPVSYRSAPCASGAARQAGPCGTSQSVPPAGAQQTAFTATTTHHSDAPRLRTVERSCAAGLTRIFAVVNCADEACPGAEAYFMQVQIRSADEPMTSFYKCTTCGKQWRD